MALNADDVIARLARRPRPRRLSSPGSGIGNPAAEKHLQIRPGGTPRSVGGGLGGERQVAQNAPYLAVAGVAEDRHWDIAVAVQRRRIAGPGECNVR